MIFKVLVGFFVLCLVNASGVVAQEQNNFVDVGTQVSSETGEEGTRLSKEEMEKVKAAGETLRTTIDDLKGNASQISSDRARLASESAGVENEIEKLREEILLMQRTVEQTRLAAEGYPAELTKLRNECQKMAKQNEVLESKIATREEMAKKKS